jgi:cytoskeletal protein CcmA (bactofilin family)
MLQPPDTNKNSQFTPNPNAYPPAKPTISSPTEQATIGRTLVIKGEISGSETLYIDGRVEGSIHLNDNRVTIGRNGTVAANITAKEVVIMGKVTGNIECSDRLDIRSEGSLTGDVVTPRISVEDGAILKGSVQVKIAESKNQKSQPQQSKPAEAPKPAFAGQPNTMAASAGA